MGDVRQAGTGRLRNGRSKRSDTTSRCPTLQSNDERKLVKVTAIKRIYPIRGFKHQTVRTTLGINISFKIHHLLPTWMIFIFLSMKEAISKFSKI